MAPPQRDRRGSYATPNDVVARTGRESRDSPSRRPDALERAAAPASRQQPRDQRQSVGVTDGRPPLPMTRLLEESGWIRALAQALVADPGSADDVAQDSLVAAMSSPPPSGVAPRAWLSGIVR